MKVDIIYCTVTAHKLKGPDISVISITLLTKRQFCSDWFIDSGWWTLSNGILSVHLEQVLCAFIQLGDLEPSGVGINGTRVDEAASVGVSFLNDVRLDLGASVALRGLPLQDDVVSEDFCHLQVPGCCWFTCQ